VTIVLITAIFALILAFVLGLALGFFEQFFAVESDPLIAQIRAFLPGANCGACGYPGCDGYAAAVASKEAGTSMCSVGGTEAAERISALMGVDAEAVSVVAVLACGGIHGKALLKGNYIGLPSCRGAKISAGGTKLCSWGCMGFGDCVKACKFGALSMGGEGIPEIDYATCVGCKLCMAACPQQLIRDIPKKRTGALPVCSNRNPVKSQVIKTCKAGCIKCELCVKNCPEQCIVMQNGIPLVDYSKCVSCGTCVEKCPTKVMKLIGRDIVINTARETGAASA
jgi:Na+-translocating ferredoxin:NAD+ oxidoreductase RNF subunit RnfB